MLLRTWRGKHIFYMNLNLRSDIEIILLRRCKVINAGPQQRIDIHTTSF